MITLDHLLIDEAVLTSTFACDLQQCKGACCTLPGGSGAPLADTEVEHVKAAVEHALPYLDERARNHIAKHGAVEGHTGSYATTCIDDRDCVFVTYEQGVATCAIEKAWHAGVTGFRKPLSCHLFPIRVANFGGPYLHYEKFDECAPGRALGERIGLPLVVALKDAIERAYGADIYEQMLALANEHAAGGSL
jgi:hypothetical protein